MNDVLFKRTLTTFLLFFLFCIKRRFPLYPIPRTQTLCPKFIFGDGSFRVIPSRFLGLKFYGSFSFTSFYYCSRKYSAMPLLPRDTMPLSLVPYVMQKYISVMLISTQSHVLPGYSEIPGINFPLTSPISCVLFEGTFTSFSRFHQFPSFPVRFTGYPGPNSSPSLVWISYSLFSALPVPRIPCNPLVPHFPRPGPSSSVLYKIQISSVGKFLYR